MKLVYDATGEEVRIGDVTVIHGLPHEVTFFRKPHKPSSEGKVSLKYGDDNFDDVTEYYVSVIGATWIDREDRVTSLCECGKPMRDYLRFSPDEQCVLAWHGCTACGIPEAGTSVIRRKGRQRC